MLIFEGAIGPIPVDMPAADIDVANPDGHHRHIGGAADAKIAPAL